jgi:hypothetical protein
VKSLPATPRCIGADEMAREAAVLDNSGTIFVVVGSSLIRYTGRVDVWLQKPQSGRKPSRRHSWILNSGTLNM